MEVFYESPDGRAKLYLGDAIEVMASFPDACVDAIVTDPPYGLEFMGKEWDKFGKFWDSTRTQKPEGYMGSDGVFRQKTRAFSANIPTINTYKAGQAYQSWTSAWATEAYRILKPGGYMLVMGGTRTHHRLGCGLEDAGFEIRDELAWIFATGFPKNYDVSKGIDKRAGAEREVVGKYQLPNGQEWNLKQADDPDIEAAPGTFTASGRRTLDKTQPATPKAQYWEGYGTALKPAHEPIWLCKKPNEGTYVDNVLKHGCGAMNIDVARTPLIGVEEHKTGGTSHLGDRVYGQYDNVEKLTGDGPTRYSKKGRWPANVLVDCWPEEFIGGGVVLEREIRLHGPPKEGLRGPEIRWKRTGESEGDRELWTFTEEYFDDEEMDEEEGCTVYPYTQFVWLRRTAGGVVIEGEAQHWKREYSHSTKGMKNFGGGQDAREERSKYLAEQGLGNGLLGPYTRFFVIPKPSKREKNKGCEDFYYDRTSGKPVRCTRERWEELIAEEERIKGKTGKRKILQARGNIHVTVKPVRLGMWLIKLITPHQHPVVVADLFCGSGSFLVSGLRLNQEQGYQIQMWGIDKDKDSVETARARVGMAKKRLLQARLL